MNGMNPWRARCALPALFLAAGLALAGCGGGGGGAEPSATPRVTYSDKVAAGTLENYMNADWLFQNYLGNYGVPDKLKPQFMPAMKLLANGFMLQYKTGQDVRANIEQVHAMFLQYNASGEGTRFFAQVQAEAAAPPSAPAPPAPSASPPLPERPEPEYLPYISPEDQAAIDEAKERDRKEAQEIREMAERYGLPYRIEEVPEQWFIYSPAMKGGGKGGWDRPEPARKTHADIYGWNWRPGDIVWTNGTGSIPGVPGHNAIVWAGGRDVRLIDAHTDSGVSLARDVQRWFDRYTEVRALTPRLHWDIGQYHCYRNYGGAFDCHADSYQRPHAWGYADSVRGSPYNWNFANPRDTSKF